MTEMVAAINERYEVLGELASGAQGVVLRARDLQSGQEVAIKQFLLGARTAYLRELAASLDNRHANLLTPLDTFYGADGIGFVVYEYLSAGTLRQSMNGKPQTLRTIMRCAEDLLRALDHLHQRNLIHCDIKPENVFVRRAADGQLSACLLGDLGSTCSLREASSGDHRSGSPAYSAPERLYQKFQANSDLYSLGVLLFELAVGSLPFSGGPREVARAHLQQPVPLEKVPVAFLRSLIGGLLEKDPTRRIASAERALRLLTSLKSDVQSAPPAPARGQATASSPPSMNKTVQKQAVIGRRPPREVARTTIESGFERVHVLEGRDGPWLAIESVNDVVTMPALNEGRPRMFPKSGAVRLLGSNELLYQTESSVNRLNVSTGSTSLVHDRCAGAIDFACDGQRLIWRTRRSAHQLDLRTRSESTFLIPHYLLEARSHLLQNGSFVVSTGPMNNQISLRDGDGTQKRLQDLDGPIIELVSERTVLLAVTLNVKRQDNYAVWRVAEFSEPQRLDIPIESRLLATTPGHVFWLEDAVQIVQCGIGLAPRPVFKLPEPIDGFAVSPDHHWVVTWTTVGEKSSRICLYSTSSESPGPTANRGERSAP